MPHRSNDILHVIFLFIQHHAHLIFGALLSIVIAYARLIHDDEKIKTIEPLLCGCLTLACAGALEMLGLPASVTTLAGGAIGFFGVNKIRELSVNFLEIKSKKGRRDED